MDPAAEEQAEDTGEHPAPSHVQEISQENIKNRINEVITEIEKEVEQEVEQDRRPSLQEQDPGAAVAADVSSSARCVADHEQLESPRPQSAMQIAPARRSEMNVSNELSENAPTPSEEILGQSASAMETADGDDASVESSQQTAGKDIGTGDVIDEKHCNIPGDGPVDSTEEVISIEGGKQNGAESPADSVSDVDRSARHGPGFTSPFASKTTSSLPRGWKAAERSIGDTARSPNQQPPTATIISELVHDTSALPTAKFPGEVAAGLNSDAGEAQNRAGCKANSLPRGWHSKRVHFAADAHVQTFSDWSNSPECRHQTPSEGAIRPSQVPQRSAAAPAAQPRENLAPHVAASANLAPNLAARPFGCREAFVVKASEPPEYRPTATGVCDGDGPPRAAAAADRGQLSEAPVPEEPPSAHRALVTVASSEPSTVFTQALDEELIPARKKTLFVDSAFFSPKVHPTWEQQVRLAKQISASLSDASNKQSKGQSMYERRRKRSVKWIHQEGASSMQRSSIGELDRAAGNVESDAEERVESPQPQKNKPLLQLVMNPHGHVYDLTALRQQGWVIDSKGGLSPEICSDLIKDLNAPTGKGAQIFAKRKKKAEKWVIDETHREHRKTEEAPAQMASVAKPSKGSQAVAAAGPPSAAGQLSRAAGPQRPQPPPQQLQQQQPPALVPVQLQSLFEPLQQPVFPSGGVYAPRTAHGWGQPHSTAPPPSAPTYGDVAMMPTYDDVQMPTYADVQMRRHAEGHETDSATARAVRQQNRQSWANYNTAPRGWGHMDSFYRPITFTQPLMSQ